MEIFWLCFFCTLSRIPGIALRYIPFRHMISKRQKQLLFTIYTAALSGNMALFFFVWDRGLMNPSFYRNSLFVFSIWMAAVNMWVIRGKVQEHLFTCGLNLCMINMIVTISGYLEHTCLNSVGIWFYMNNAWLMCLLCLITYPLFRSLIVHTITPFLTIENNHYWKWIWPIPGLIYLACYSLLPADSAQITKNLVMTVVLLNGAVMIICCCITEDYKRIMERQLMNQQLNRQREYYEELAARVEETRKIRHDFKNHLMVIRGFVMRNDTEGLLHYCEDLEVPGVKNPSIPYTGNVAADGVLYHYTGLAREQGIECHMTGSFGKLGIADMDLCVLLGNALDNAVAACTQVSGKRYINLTVSLDGEVLAIMIQNSFDGRILEENGEILSRKRQHETGIGLKSMKDICKKYHGSMQVRYEGTEFSCMILLNQTKESEFDVS